MEKSHDHVTALATASVYLNVASDRLFEEGYYRLSAEVHNLFKISKGEEPTKIIDAKPDEPKHAAWDSGPVLEIHIFLQTAQTALKDYEPVLAKGIGAAMEALIMKIQRR